MGEYVETSTLLLFLPAGYDKGASGGMRLNTLLTPNVHFIPFMRPQKLFTASLSLAYDSAVSQVV